MKKYKVNSRAKSEGRITLSFTKVPAHCGECQLYVDTYYYDEFSGRDRHYCPFGGDMYGCLVERPANCPITIEKSK